MKKTKLQTRFFISYVLLALIIVGSFSAFFYEYTSRILIERETQNIVNLTSTFKSQTDEAIKTMDTISINIGYSNLIMSNIETFFSEEEASYAEKSSLAELFVAINGTDSQVAQMNIYDFTGGVVGFGTSNVTSSVDFSQLDWYKPTLELHGLKYISQPYLTDILSKGTNVSNYYMSLYRTYYNKYGKQTGFIETMQTCKKIFKDVSSYGKKNKDAPLIYIFDQNGILQYPYNSAERSDMSVYSHYFDAVKNNAGHTFLANPRTNDRELIVSDKSAYTGWTYITVQPEATILTPVQTLSKLLVVVVLSLLFIASIISVLVSRSLIKPIKQLRNIIRKTELSTLGEHEGRALHSSFDELEELNQSFQNMSSDLKTSMNELIDTKQQELKSRNLALQSQINPHFYYNSLSSIIILAEDNKSEDVVSLCRNLSKIMRYITDGSSLVVTVRQELDYVEKYLYCMKVRYQSSLNYTISVDDSILDIQIPKLIIQPLVENALKYGTNCFPPWNISVVSTVCDDYWRIDVIDSGNGFTDEALALLEKRLELAKETTGMPDIQIDGMGLLNVYSRWKLFCQEDAIFSCTNTKDGGASVSIGRYTHKENREEE